MPHCIARGTGTQERGTFTTQVKCYIYCDQSHKVEHLLQLEIKQQIIPNKVETQHKHMFSLYIGSLCYIHVAFPMAHLTCIMSSQVFMKI